MGAILVLQSSSLIVNREPHKGSRFNDDLSPRFERRTARRIGLRWLFLV
jgi:hypothetical protein